MALNTLNTHVTRHFASFFRRTTYRHGDASLPEGFESTEDSHEYPNDVSLTSPLAKARLIGVSSLHSTTHHYPMHTHARIHARATRIQIYIHVYTLLSPSLATIFSLRISTYLFRSFTRLSLSLSPTLSLFLSRSPSFYLLLHLFFLSFFDFFSIESALLSLIVQYRRILILSGKTNK